MQDQVYNDRTDNAASQSVAITHGGTDMIIIYDKIRARLLFSQRRSLGQRLKARRYFVMAICLLVALQIAHVVSFTTIIKISGSAHKTARHHSLVVHQKPSMNGAASTGQAGSATDDIVVSQDPYTDKQTTFNEDAPRYHRRAKYDPTMTLWLLLGEVALILLVLVKVPGQAGSLLALMEFASNGWACSLRFAFRGQPSRE